MHLGYFDFINTRRNRLVRRSIIQNTELGEITHDYWYDNGSYYRRSRATDVVEIFVSGSWATEVRAAA